MGRRQQKISAAFSLLSCAWMGLAWPQGLEKVTYLPHWVPQAQFAGCYVAEAKGYYRDEGLEVEILRGGPEQPASTWLAEGKTDFTSTFLATMIEKRAAGVPVVNIAQLGRRSALLLVAKSSSGIRSPADLDGRRVMIWDEFRLQPLALFRKFQVQPRILPQRNTLDLFLLGGAEAISAMWYNEFHLLLNCGLNEDELVIFRYDEHGLNFPEDGLYCLESLLREKPQVCQAFVRATLKGWRYAFTNPEEALDITMLRVAAANMPTTRVHHRWMLKIMKEIMWPEGNDSAWGQLAEEDYMRVARELRVAGMIHEIPTFAEFYHGCAE